MQLSSPKPNKIPTSSRKQNHYISGCTFPTPSLKNKKKLVLKQFLIPVPKAFFPHFMITADRAIK